jgi:hypothetical protein
VTDGIMFTVHLRFSHKQEALFNNVTSLGRTISEKVHGMKVKK